MTSWEFKGFSWSGNKTNKGDLLIKLDFHSQESFGSLAHALISIVAQSWERRSQGRDLWDVDERNQRSLGPPKRRLPTFKPPTQERRNHESADGGLLFLTAFIAMLG